MKISRNIQGKNIEVHCDEKLQKAGFQLLSDLQEMNDQGKKITKGTTILYGWVTLKFEERGESLVVVCPDIANEMTDRYCDDISLVLEVLISQAAFLKSINSEGVSAIYTDKVIVQNGALSEPKIYLERNKPTGEGDSGWYIGLQDGDAPGVNELTAIYVFKLITLYPAIVPLLALPIGSLVKMENGMVDAIFDADDNKIFSAKD